jgi:hypothetical protein
MKRTDSWMNHKFNLEEAERLNTIEEWAVEHDDEVAVRILAAELDVEELKEMLSHLCQSVMNLYNLKPDTARFDSLMVTLKQDAIELSQSQHQSDKEVK